MRIVAIGNLDKEIIVGSWGIVEVNGKQMFTRLGIYKNGAWNAFEGDFIPDGLDTAINEILFTENGSLIIAGRWSDPLEIPADPQQAIVLAGNSAATFPWMTIDGPAVVTSITNKTTGKTIYFSDTAVVPAGSTLEVHFQPEKIRVTLGGRNRLDLIHPGSDLTDFALQPGINRLAVSYQTFQDNPTEWPAVWVRWQPRFWSLEGLVHGEI